MWIIQFMMILKQQRDQRSLHQFPSLQVRFDFCDIMVCSINQLYILNILIYMNIDIARESNTQVATLQAKLTCLQSMEVELVVMKATLATHDVEVASLSQTMKRLQDRFTMPLLDQQWSFIQSQHKQIARHVQELQTQTQEALGQVCMRQNTHGGARCDLKWDILGDLHFQGQQWQWEVSAL